MSRGSRSRRAGDPARRRVATSAAGLVAAVLESRGAARVVRERRVVTEWRRIVGDRVAERAWPLALVGDVLHVRVVNSAWLQELTFLREAMLKAIAERLGPPLLVRELRLQLPGRGAELAGPNALASAQASAKRPVLAPRPAEPPLTAEAAHAIEHETAQVADDDLRAALRGLRRRLGR